MQIPSKADFEAMLGQAYPVVNGGGIALTFARLEVAPNSPREGGGFRLEIAGPSAPILDQGIYAFEGAAAPFEIFIVPIANDGAHTTYEAIFN